MRIDERTQFHRRHLLEWVGLRKGQRARGRLDAFYGKHGVGTPDWMAKVDAGRLISVGAPSH